MTAKSLALGAAVSRVQDIAGRTATLQLDTGIPEGARHLIWHEFFVSRSRGIDWATHLPWADGQTALCATASIDSTIVAALLVRRLAATNTAMIGYVCVSAMHRGHGISRQLIDFVAAPLRALGITGILLWTSMPAIYRACGFTVTAQERNLMLKGGGARQEEEARMTAWPSGKQPDMPGLPPFATAGWRATGPAADIVFVDTPTGATLLDQSGTPEDVLRIMFKVRPGDWRATTPPESVFRELVITRGICIDDRPGPCQMFRPIAGSAIVSAFVPPAIRI